MKILVVHREVSVLNQVKTILQNREMVIRYFNSGLDALLAARVETFDLIICGTDLPVVTGFELIRSIRTNSINAAIPVIFITEELNAKSEYLANALKVTGTLALATIAFELVPLLNDIVDSTVPLSHMRYLSQN